MSCGDEHYPIKTIKPPHLTIFFSHYIFRSMYNFVELLQIWFFLGKLVGQHFWEFFQNLSPVTALKILNRFSMQQVTFQVIDTCLEGSIKTWFPPHRVLFFPNFKKKKLIKKKNLQNEVIHNTKKKLSQVIIEAEQIWF
jgi:hypothetical protein